MHRVEMNAAEAEALVERLTEVKELRDSPREERQWLVSHGELRRYERGEIISPMTAEVTEMIVQLTGRTAVYVDHGTGRRHLLESPAGTVTGLLPYSRLSRPPGDAIVDEPSEVLAVHRSQLMHLTRECPAITTALVHSMLDRSRRSVATDWQDEKMVSLGRLAAGIAHEMNNPASAAARGASQLQQSLRDLTDASRALQAAGLRDDQRDEIESAILGRLNRPVTSALSPLERADREEALFDWLESHAADTLCAASLAEHGVTLEGLDELADSVPHTAINAVLRYFAATFAAQSLVREVERATTRICDLVAAVKRFTNMDRAGVPSPTDIAQGLADTVAVLASKARERGIIVSLDIEPELPLVLASVAELNQVWSNLLDNALDAVAPAGEVIVSAITEGGIVVVRVIDNGPGIPPELQSRIFDPFFTTKRVGEGVGLGLEIARRIVRAHEGQVDVESMPGRTEFRVRLPAAQSSAAPTSADAQ